MGFVIGPHQKMLKEFPDMVRTRPFECVIRLIIVFLITKLFDSIQVKRMELSYYVEKVLKEDIPRLQHGADGLIYTCVDSPYVVGTDPKLQVFHMIRYWCLTEPPSVSSGRNPHKIALTSS